MDKRTLFYQTDKGEFAMIKVDIWSDFVCPFCYIGKRELDNAIKEKWVEEQVELTFKSFELSPNGPTEPTTAVLENLSKKSGRSLEEMKDITQPMIERAAGLGLDYNYDNLKAQDTLKAHRLSKYAEAEGKMQEFQERLFHGVFTENVFLPDTEQLVKLAVDVGLNEEKAREIAEDETKYLGKVQDDRKTAGALGVNSVPFFVFNDKYAVQGAQLQETFEQVLEKVKEEATE